MPAARVSVRRVREILRLKFECGRSERAIAVAVSVARSTVQHIKIRGQWRYLYRAVDRSGALIDVMLSTHRDLAAARTFFRSATAVTGLTPDRVTSDGHDAYPAAIQHRTSIYLNNQLEQDHRGIKDRYRSMRGFKNLRAARRFCRTFDELRNFLRVRAVHRERVPADCRATAPSPQRHHRARNPSSCLNSVSPTGTSQVGTPLARTLTKPCRGCLPRAPVLQYTCCHAGRGSCHWRGCRLFGR